MHKIEPNKGNIQKWYDLLVSGEDIQTKNTLYDGVGYCCLGIACKAYAKEKGWSRPWVRRSTGRYQMFCGTEEFTVLPKSVQEWLGLPAIPLVNSSENTSVAILNDEYDKSFKELAELIKQTYLENDE